MPLGVPLLRSLLCSKTHAIGTTELYTFFFLLYLDASYYGAVALILT